MADILPKNGKAWYHSAADGRRALVDVVNVHFDDEPPYYTIRLGGAERSTVRSRLSPATTEEVDAANAAASAANAADDSDALDRAIERLRRSAEEREAAAVKSKTPRRAASPRRRAAPSKPSRTEQSSSAWQDEKAAEVGGRCMSCGGKNKSIYRSCAECVRSTGRAAEDCILCTLCARSCDTCEISLCAPCKRDSHTSCRRCGARCRRADYHAGKVTGGKDRCCTCDA